MMTGLYGRLTQAREERKGLSAKTISYIHSTLHKVLSDAVDAGLLVKNVASTVKPPRPSRRATGGIQAWEPDELARFLQAVRGTRAGAIWRLSAMTGMRRGELLGLRWCDLDLDRTRLSVRQALVAVGYEVVHSTPKSHSARMIDLDTETVNQLRAHADARTRSGRSGAPTTTTRISSWPRRTGSRSTRTRSARHSSA
jgi:integrase